MAEQGIQSPNSGSQINKINHKIPEDEWYLMLFVLITSIGLPILLMIIMVLWVPLLHIQHPYTKSPEVIYLRYHGLLFKMLFSLTCVQQIEISNIPGDPFPAEKKHKKRFSTANLFRNDDFPLQIALQEYYADPIAYALMLADINKELYVVVQRRETISLEELLLAERYQRQTRDLVGGKLLTMAESWKCFGFPQHYAWRRRGSRRLRSHRLEGGSYLPLTNGELETDGLLANPRSGDSNTTQWMVELSKFRKNTNTFCQYTGSEVDELAMPGETINNLRKFASDRRQELAPLLQINAQLKKQLDSYKRINAALQIRHTIEKLTFELPETPRYDVKGSGPKWHIFWDDIWNNAATDSKNPFHKLWMNAKGDYARNNYRDKGRDLFADMSGEIHGYDKRDFDYEHFDSSARNIANVLRPEIIDGKTGEVDWKDEIKKYPGINWPSTDNLPMTKVQRMESDIEYKRRRLAKIEEELLEAKDEEVRLREEGEVARLEREEHRTANAEQDIDLGGFFFDN